MPRRTAEGARSGARTTREVDGALVLPIPSSLADLTPTWLTRAFREAGLLHCGRVVQTTHVRIGQEYGFTGVVGRVQIRYEDTADDLPESLVVKLPMALDDAASGFRKAQERDPARMRRHFERCAREERFYRVIGAPFLPRLYYSAADEISRRVVLLLEDVSGGRQGDVLRGCSVDDLTHVIDQLAPFHARYWDGRAPTVGFESPRLAPAAGQKRYQHLLEIFLESHGDAMSPEVRRIATRLGTRLAVVAERLNDGPRTLTHGDLHLDNLIFDSPGRAVVILDWQIASVGPPAWDVALLIYGSLDVEQRRAGEADLLERYASLLFEHGVGDYSTANLSADCELALLLILAGTVAGLTTVRRDDLTGRERALQESALTPEGRLVSALLDHKIFRSDDRTDESQAVDEQSPMRR